MKDPRPNIEQKRAAVRALRAKYLSAEQLARMDSLMARADKIVAQGFDLVQAFAITGGMRAALLAPGATADNLLDAIDAHITRCENEHNGRMN